MPTARKQSRRKRRAEQARPEQQVSTIPSKPASGPAAIWIALALAALTIAIYAPVRDAGFLSFDDPQYVTENPHIARGLTWSGIRWALTAQHAANWHPLTWVSHMLDISLFGLSSAAPHHWINVALHAVSALLLFLLLIRMTGALWQSAFVAALFAVHPLRVESVAWVAERKDVLSVLLSVVALHAYVSYTRRPQFWRYALLVAVFALALMAKPVVTLPFVLLLLDVWPLERARLQWDQLAKWLRLAAEKVPLLALSFASSLITLEAQSKAGAVSEAFSFGERAANALSAYVTYLGQMLWPAGLAAFYPYRPLPAWWVIICALFLMAACVMAFKQARRRPYAFVGWFWYVGTLVPVIGLVQVGQQAGADRYTYIPFIGIALMLVWAASDALGGWCDSRHLLSVAAGVLIAASAVAANAQVRYWKNDAALWRRAVDVTENNYFAHMNYGVVLAAAGKGDAAIAEYSQALAIQPRLAEAHNARGVIRMERGEFEPAIADYREAIRIKPNYAEPHANLGAALAQLGQMSEAASHLKMALDMEPENAKFRQNMGFALAQQGKLDEAIAEYKEALRLKPGVADVHNKLGSALFAQGKLDEAIDQYQKALRIQPAFADALNNLGMSVERQGNAEHAIALYSDALRARPDFADAHNNLGVALARQNKVDEAVRHFAEAVRIQPRHLSARNNLGFLLTRQGKTREAQREFSEALRIDPNNVAARVGLNQLARGNR
jgi:tetratricopeptide (TPR) repeat protein